MLRFLVSSPPDAAGNHPDTFPNQFHSNTTSVVKPPRFWPGRAVIWHGIGIRRFGTAILLAT